MRINKSANCLIWLFLFVAFGEILKFSNAWILIGGGAICTVLYARQKCLRIDAQFCLLALTLILYVGLDKGWSAAVNMSFTYVFLIIFFMAHYLSAEIQNNIDANKEMVVLLLAMILAVTVHGVLNSYMWLDGRWWEGNFRMWKDFWSGEYKYAAWQNSYYLPAMASFFPMLIYRKDKKILINIFVILSAVFFAYISLVSESRVTAIMFPILIFVQMIVYFILERKRVAEKINRKQLIVVICTVSILLLVGGVVFVSSTFGKNFLEIMNRDGGIFNNIRFKFQRQALGQLFMYPFGGRQMTFMGYAHAHNAWIDVAAAGGVIPFVSFALYTVISSIELFKLLKKPNVSTELKLFFAGIYIAYLMIFTIESAFESYGRYIAPWIFIQGLIHGYISKKDNV